MSTSSRLPPSPNDDFSSRIRKAVQDFLERDDWERVLLRTFYFAFTLPSYRQAAVCLRITPSGVIKRVAAVQAALTDEVGEPVVLVVSLPRGGVEVTPLGKQLLQSLRFEFAE